MSVELSKNALKEIEYPYPDSVEKLMKKVYKSLSEKERRTYAAVEVLKLPYGGKDYICKVLGCTSKTINRGIKELNGEESAPTKARNTGGGRKKQLDKIPFIDDVFLRVIDTFTGGDPMREEFRWINLGYRQIAKRMSMLLQKVIGKGVVQQLLKKHKFGLRKAGKLLSIGSSDNRNEQFENIDVYKSLYKQMNWPIISMDTKKKEQLGLYRDGSVYTTEQIKVPDHDFVSSSQGVFIPHGIYDVIQNTGYITIGNDHDTSEFACASLRNWWNDIGVKEYPTAQALLILADGGGSNSSRHYIFKEDLEKLAQELGIELRMAHYPPYTSKWNPIEHRLFCHISSSLKGVILKSYEFGKKLLEETITETGLTVTARILLGEFKTKRKYAKDYKENMKIVFDDFLPKWNYCALPCPL